jgi:polynucleotide 5'-hydroxyl-kinase GRC3/NOL9
MSFMVVMPEPGWRGLVRLLKDATSVFIGMTDVGKSTLVRYMIGELLSDNVRVCLVDADVGQSALGMPGTISMKVFEGPGDMERYTPERMFFIGTDNPAGKIHLMIEGTRKFVDSVRAEGVGTILVDTTGFVQGKLGRALKQGKIKAIRPENVIAIERADELEHILALIQGVRVHRFRASRLARGKTRAERIRYREERFGGYFRGSGIVEQQVDEVEFLYGGRPFDIGVSTVAPGALVGLNKGEETAALGVFKGFMDGRAVIKTPLKSIKGINRILIGDIRL